MIPSPTKKKRFTHECELPKEDQVLKCSPFAAPTQKLWTIINKWKTVSESEEAHKYFRSNKAISKERQRHLRTPEFKYSIHPFSKLARIQFYVICPTWLIILILGPTFSAFTYEAYAEKQAGLYYLRRIIIFCRAVVVIDIILRFFRGFVIKKTGKIVLDRNTIVKEYLKSYFLIDVTIPIIGITLLILSPSATTAQIITRQMNFIALGRVKSLMEKLEFFWKSINIREDIRTCLFLVTLSTFIVHWWTCLLKCTSMIYDQYDLPQRNLSWYFVWERDINASIFTASLKSKDFATSDFQIYFIHLSVVLCHFFGTWIHRYHSKDSFERILLSFVLISGMMFCIYAMAKILQFYGMVNFSEMKYEELIYQAEQYMIKQRYPRRLKKRVLTYYDYKFDKKYFSEELILTGLSEHLRLEVILYSCKNLVTDVPHFRNLSKATMGSILALIKPEIYLPGDVLMSVIDDEPKLVFLLYGTVSVCLPTGTELMHREDGSIIGNVSDYLFGKYRPSFIYYIVALETCEIYWMSKEEIKFCCDRHPDLAEKMKNLGRLREKMYNDTYSHIVGGESSDSLGIVDELRKGLILAHGIQRDVFDIAIHGNV